MSNLLFDDVLDRLLSVLGVNLESEIARFLGLTPQTFANRKRSGSIPFKEIIALSIEKNISIDWLMTGKGLEFVNLKSVETIENFKNTFSNLEKLNDQLLDMNAVIDEVMNDIVIDFGKTPGLKPVLTVQARTLKRELKRLEATVDELIRLNQKELDESKTRDASVLKADSETHQAKQKFHGKVGQVTEGDSVNYGGIHMGSDEKKK